MCDGHTDKNLSNRRREVRAVSNALPASAFVRTAPFATFSINSAFVITFPSLKDLSTTTCLKLQNSFVCYLPLVSDKTIDLHLKTLEEALASDEMDITEIDDEGSIPKLKFANRGAGTILILQGSIIKANKQDRAVKTTFVVHPHAVVEGDVFCIEASRWHSVRGQKGYKPDRNLSADICMDFSKSKSSQQDIWRKIEEKRRRMQV
ncbi:MAG TPA: DUF6569 family protein, partial [Thermodesulfovibrionales bacterium]|nr:DUF6569 family protein [Thermodesulfovibrionales bacterium]